VIGHFKLIFYFSGIILGCVFFYDGYQNLKYFDKLDIKVDNNFVVPSSKTIEDKGNNTKKKIIKNNNKTNNYIKTELLVLEGDTLSSILKQFNFTDNEIYLIVNEIEKYFDLRQLKVNQKINIYADQNKKIKKIELNLSIDKILEINLNDQIIINQKKLNKNYFQESKEFKIQKSLYSDGIKNGLPQEILIKLIKLFSFDLDFQRDIRNDTLVSVSYDYNQIIENGITEFLDINYALISIEGKKLEYFKFLTDDDYIDYFNREGKNVKKSILKTPLDGARLSSNFGMRKHPISGYNKMHKGVDFAAPIGTPIYAGGNGVIEYVGNNGGYGKYIRIRHNNEYKTAYAHLSGYKKGIAKGKRVNQGDVIGYVGNTGVSTGPHLHYEIIFQNKHINPLKLKLPSGKVLKGNELKRFQKEYKIIYANHLNLLYE